MFRLLRYQGAFITIISIRDKLRLRCSTSTVQSTYQVRLGLSRHFSIDNTMCSKDADYDCMVQKLKEKIQSFPDFPKKGILFWDIFSALRDGPTCSLLQKILIQTIKCRFPNVEAVVGLEARGFLFSFSIAQEMGIGCLPVRKKGKLPGEVVSYTYDLEYGFDTFEVQKKSIRPGLKCVILDDLIATGGSLNAAIKLLQENGAQVLGSLVIIELLSLEGQKNLPCDVKVHSLIKYD